MRMNYMMIPVDYIQQLKRENIRGQGRKKARCFMEYWDDMEQGEHNSYGFYAKSWDVSKSTVYAWVDDFNTESELFISHWELKNKKHYRYVKNSAERSPNETNANEALDIGNVEKHAERSPNKALNNFNNNNPKTFITDKDYLDLYFVYARNTNYVGKKSDAYEAFANTDVHVDLLKLASMKYLHDTAVDRPVGIKKFLEESFYLPYLPKYMKVKHGDAWYQGTYDDKTFEFVDQDNKSLGTIEPNLLIELFEKNELVYLKTLDEKLHA